MVFPYKYIMSPMCLLLVYPLGLIEELDYKAYTMGFTIQYYIPFNTFLKVNQLSYIPHQYYG